MKQEKGYFVAETENGIVFILAAKSANPIIPERAEITYDGGLHALLKKSETDITILDFLPNEIKLNLKRATQATILECDKNDVILLEYPATVKVMDFLPPFSLEITEPISEAQAQELMSEITGNTEQSSPAELTEETAVSSVIPAPPTGFVTPAQSTAAVPPPVAPARPPAASTQPAMAPVPPTAPTQPTPTAGPPPKFNAPNVAPPIPKK